MYMTMLSSVNEIITEDMMPICNKCKNWWHLKNFHSMQTTCYLCKRKEATFPTTSIKDILKHNYVIYLTIKDKLWENFWDVIQSFSYFWVTVKKSDKWERATNTGYNRLPKDFPWSKVPLETEIHLKNDEYITRQDAYILFVTILWDVNL